MTSRTSSERLAALEHNSWLYMHEKDEIRDRLDAPEDYDMDWEATIFEERVRGRKSDWERSQ